MKKKIPTVTIYKKGKLVSKTPYKPFLSQKAYVSKKGCVCPICGWSYIEGRQINIDGTHAVQEIVCLVCETVWDDVYNLSGYENVKMPRVVKVA